MIIAIKEKDRVVVAYSNADSKCNLCEKDYVDEENVAIRISKTGRIFACGDMNSYADIILYDDELIESEITPKSIVKEVIPYLKETFKENQKPIDKEGQWRNALVICDNEHIYDIGPKFGFAEITDYVCHGYNIDDVISVLDETKELAPEKRILNALKFIGKLNKESLFPMVLVDTKTKSFKVVKSEDVVEEE